MKSDLDSLTEKVEAKYDADLLVYFGPVSRKWDDFLIDVCKARDKRKNVLLLLTTYGGDAHAAYRIARCLQQNYHRPTNQPGQTKVEGQVIIYVPSICASAGTLITLVADRLILSDHSELGPLDVQIRKPDEVGERTSGLTPIQALNYLEKETRKFFKAQFDGLRFERSLSFSTRMAADVSAQLAGGLLSHLYEQIDPLRLAEYDRTNRIAEQYGERIKSKNVKEHTISQLLEKYPAHEFCIDAVEAKELFTEVEQPTRELEEIGNFLKPFAEQRLNKEETAVFYLGDTKQKNTNGEEQNEPKPNPGQNGKPDASDPTDGDGSGGNTKTVTTTDGPKTAKPATAEGSRA